MTKHIYTLPPYLNPLRAKILPVFIPFAGCPQRCIYCSQTLQTGRGEDSQEYIYKKTMQELARLLHAVEKPLPAWLHTVGAEVGAEVGIRRGTERGNKNYELAFYGGTFTALPIYWQEKWLHLAQKYKNAGLISKVRCSTRPDAVNDKNMLRLKTLGLDLVELGIQSFDDDVLEKSCRGYTANTAKGAARAARLAGLPMVLQLMPGLPGASAQSFYKDIYEAIALAPLAIRLYPCLVLKGTPLAKMWQTGSYQPWEIAETIDILSKALPLLWKANIPVIRLGVAAEESLLPHILAGPWHPAMGSLVQGRAIFYWIKEAIALRCAIKTLTKIKLPKYLQGPFWGERGALKPHYAALGVYPQNTSFWNWPVCCFETD